MNIPSLVVIAVLSIALAIGIVGFSMVSTSDVALENSIGSEAATLASGTMDQIDNLISSKIDYFQTVASNQRIKALLQESNAEYAALPNRDDVIQQKDREWIAAPKDTLTPDMKELIYHPISQELRDIVTFFNRSGSMGVGEIFITNAYGVNVVQTHRTSDFLQSDEDWWIQGMKNRIFVTGVGFDDSSGVYSTDFILRIDDDNGTPLGIMKVVLNVNEVSQILKNADLTAWENGDTMKSTLLTEDGKIVYSTGPFTVFEDASQLLSAEQADHYAIGDKFLTAYAHSNGYRGKQTHGLVLVQIRPVTEILSPVNNLALSIFIYLLIIVAIVLIIAATVSRRITVPLSQLQQAATRVSKGNLSVNVPVVGLTETKKIADSFNIMINNLRTSQAEVKKRTQELESRVHERTADLDSKVKELTQTKERLTRTMKSVEEANSRLQLTQKRLKENARELELSNKKKSEFISIAAHELKTPMTAISGFSQFLRTSSIPEAEEDRYLGIIDQETRRLSHLVDMILDLSRIDLNTVRLSIEHVSLTDILHIVRKEIDVIAHAKGLHTIYIFPGHLPTIRTDRERLLQILLNLLTNAVKYTQTGSITFRVEHEGEQMHFSVTDTGIGIPEDSKKFIFTRFFQVDSSYTRKQGGTGLGLSLCKEFVALLGGRIWFESTEGKGSVFHVTLPVEGPSH